MIIVVDDDINVFNDGDVMWAVGTRFDAARDLLVIPRWSGPGGLLPVGWDFHPDGSKSPRMITAVVIDATKPIPPAAYPPRAIVPAAAVEAAKATVVTDLTEADL
jgi:2,5-furandicarboxylate decarboxylase 1